MIEGPTLADRIKQGPIPLDEALPIAKQIAEALEAAHEAGVIHRDLKPANIKVRDDGTVKVLDFGLAKALDPHPEGDPSQSPTLTAAATQMGVIMGTAAYMSPEQARGKPVDKRADIWAFGCVLYEMLSGKQLFHGEDVSEVLARVIRDEPSLHEVPGDLRRLVKRCLAKDPRQRLRDIGDVWELVEERTPVGQPTARTSTGRQMVAWTVAGVLLVLLAGLAAVHFGESSPVPEPLRFEMGGPAGAATYAISVSPDGRDVAFVARNSDGEDQVWVRPLARLESQALAGTDGASPAGLFWSPDGRYIGFASQGRLKKVRLNGAPPQIVCDLGGRFLGGAWSPDGVIVFAGERSGLMQVPDAGGTPSLLVAGEGGQFRGTVGHPSFLPDGRTVVYLRTAGMSTDPDITGIYLGSLDSDSEHQRSERVLVSRSAAVFASPPQPGSTTQSPDAGGLLLFEREGVLIVAPQGSWTVV